MTDLADLFPGLYQASFRGVEFHMPDSRHEVGRRSVRTLFPGADFTIDEDLGALDGPIKISGLIIGDDYIRRAKAMTAAFRTAGPGVLSHPWLGELDVVLSGTGAVSFADGKMRLARFEATFLIWQEPRPAVLDTLDDLLNALDDIKAQTRAMLRTVLAPLALPLAVLTATQNFCTGAATTWSGLLIGGQGISSVLNDTAAAFQQLAAVASLAVGASYPDQVADAIVAVPAAISAAALVTPTAAIGAATATTQIQPAPDVTAQLLLAAAPAWDAKLAQPAPLPQLALAARAATVAEAVRVAADISFESQQQARDWAARQDAALDATGRAAAALAASVPSQAGPVWRAVTTARRLLAADMNARVGRLPSVQTLTTPVAAPAWLIAQHLAGDTPGQVVAQFTDLVARNNIRHPGTVPAGGLEILQ